MKNKNLVIFIILFIILGVFGVNKGASWLRHQAQISLAKEMRKAISATMLDLSQAKSGSIKGVPPDGRWHHQASFNTHEYGLIDYKLQAQQLIRQDSKVQQVIAGHVQGFDLRRLPTDPMIIDVKVSLKDGVELNSNFRVRLRE